MLGELQQLFTLGATGVGIYVALNGLRSWKRELTGKRDIDLCQAVIESFYEAEQKIQELRSPFSYPAIESKNRPKRDSESDTEGRLRDTHYVPLARMDAQRDFWVSFSSRKYRMRALFGDDALKPFNEVENSLREFNAAAASRYQLSAAIKFECPMTRNLNAN